MGGFNNRHFDWRDTFGPGVGRAEERFYGVRYDIEPYLLPGFHGPRQSAILRGLLSLTDREIDELRSSGVI